MFTKYRVTKNYDIEYVIGKVRETILSDGGRVTKVIRAKREGDATFVTFRSADGNAGKYRIDNGQYGPYHFYKVDGLISKLMAVPSTTMAT